MVLVIRADASPSIGAGHVMRCIALAQTAILRGMSVHVVTRCSIPLVEQRLAALSCPVTMLPDTCTTEKEIDILFSIVANSGSSMIVLDGYHFDPEYQAALHQKTQLAILDDFAHQPSYCCDILINPSASCNQISYQERTQARLFIGHQYVMLRPEFLPILPSALKVDQSPFRILITMGASDPANATPRLLEDIAQADLDGISIVVLTGSNSPNKDSIIASLKKLRCQTEILTDVQDMPSLLQSIDVAISAGSSTCFELAKMGIPTLALETAPNQQLLFTSLSKLECVLPIGNIATLSKQWVNSLREVLSSDRLRNTLRDRALRVVDGAGANRILEVIEPTTIHLRKAVGRDCSAIWEIANSPVVRSASFSSTPIPFESHCTWYTAALASESLHIYVAENQNKALIGYIRFALNDPIQEEPRSATISVAIAQPFRGCRLGGKIIAESTALFIKDSSVSCVHALIKPVNISSIRSFESAGFQRDKTCDHSGHDALLYIFGGALNEQ